MSTREPAVSEAEHLTIDIRVATWHLGRTMLQRDNAGELQMIRRKKKKQKKHNAKHNASANEKFRQDNADKNAPVSETILSNVRVAIWGKHVP